jgi:lipid II:glycine glycyltransferase (peptidoglycan interpeptide bridge formation enzyme)
MPEIDVQINDTDHADWNSLLDRCKPDIYNIYQSYEWALLQKNTNGLTPIFVRVKEGPEILGQQLYFEKKEYGIFNAYSSIGGPICPRDKSAITEEQIINHMLSKKRQSLYIRMRPGVFSGLSEEFIKKGFTRYPVYYFLVDINKEEEDLWGGLKKNARKKINKAERCGVIIEHAKTWDLWNDFYNIYVQHSLSKKLEYKNINFFKYIYENFMPNEKAELVVALHKDTVISGVLFLCDGVIISSHISAHDDRYETYASKDLIFWHSMLWGKGKGYLTYHTDDTFPDPKSPLYSLHKFKEKWGGQLIEGSIYYHGKAYLFGKKLAQEKRRITRKLNELTEIDQFARATDNSQISKLKSSLFDSTK